MVNRFNDRKSHFVNLRLFTLLHRERSRVVSFSAEALFFRVAKRKTVSLHLLDIRKSSKMSLEDALIGEEITEGQGMA